MNEQIAEPISSETPVETAAVERTRYYNIAVPMLEKGFTVWPVRPEPEKAGEFGSNTHAYYADEIVHRCLAKKFPNHNAAVISRRGIGNLMFLDIDSPGVLERLKKRLARRYLELRSQFAADHNPLRTNGTFIFGRPSTA